VTYTKNNKSVNPLFVSETDFHLKSGSPAISAGINAGIQVDHDDKPFASPPSIGAYEYFLY
jgi:peptide methionine sulfoxide reductase MsrB